MAELLLTLPGMYFTVVTSTLDTLSYRRKRMKHTLVLCAITLAFVGCASTINKEEYSKLAEQTENEIKLANKTGFLWLNTEKTLSESREAMDAAMAASDRATRESEYSKAMKLAKKALQEAKLAQQQARDNTSPNIKIQ